MKEENPVKERNSDEQKAEGKTGFGNECNPSDSKGFLVGTSNIHPRA